ncbi:fumarylacetoacetase [Neptunitalea lumnitzerae]|uniref:fumarylacetoacetase n=1 Tax=Neptunitalea lumnitzerae TaxID=2965509 RepID=A0ABQ5MJI5_9FLAO|nr:fumarylacetoacetase [Neptunitalea sp. Y10]GLB49492.1 fumarylacetoacetase [Neptunitalea sp. Y10]
MKHLKSWVEVPDNSDFTIYNIPFGVFKTLEITPRLGAAIGNYVLDLAYLADHDYFSMISPLNKKVFHSKYLNEFMALGKPITNAVRLAIIDLLSESNPKLQEHTLDRKQALIPIEQVTMLLPIDVKNYTDFYSSKEHATNVGVMFRDPENALLPNWSYIPIGYHGRASSVIPSGTMIQRPKGQIIPQGENEPILAPTKALDFELEMGFITGKSNMLGTSIQMEDAEDYIFGMVLLNDWSARDIQKWEYVPLGPFLGKNFATSISPWVVTMEALEPFRTAGPIQIPEALPYLAYSENKNYDIHLSVDLKTECSNKKTICNTNFKYMYWNMCQQLVHHTINGCNIQVGDLYGSGTISGKDSGSYGSMLELSWNTTKPIALGNGITRTFLEDGDTIIMKGYAEKDTIRVGFGEVNTTILPTN